MGVRVAGFFCGALTRPTYHFLRNHCGSYGASTARMVKSDTLPFCLQIAA
jgi:hypothetical protein